MKNLDVKINGEIYLENMSKEVADRYPGTTVKLIQNENGQNVLRFFVDPNVKALGITPESAAILVVKYSKTPLPEAAETKSVSQTETKEKKLEEAISDFLTSSCLESEEMGKKITSHIDTSDAQFKNIFVSLNENKLSISQNREMITEIKKDLVALKTWQAVIREAIKGSE